VIRGHIALVRMLQAYFEGSRLPWGKVTFKHDKDDDDRPIYERDRVELTFTHRGRDIGIVIFAPDEERPEEGAGLPNGRLAARFDDGSIIKGPIDQATWDRIVAAINQ
jgi:hypothetical protein